MQAAILTVTLIIDIVEKIRIRMAMAAEHTNLFLSNLFRMVSVETVQLFTSRPIAAQMILDSPIAVEQPQLTISACA
jgi:hypothetical protein